MATEAGDREALALSAVSAGYGRTTVIEGIDLELGAGRSASVIGRNGMGKTTLLATVMGYTRQHAGSIAVDGVELSALPTWRRVRAGLGIVPQEREIFPSLSVEENMQIACRPGAWSVERVYDLFPRLFERRGNLGDRLSGGEQQMLAIGRALVGNPRVLLMDEPTEGLAPVVVEELQQTFARLRCVRRASSRRSTGASRRSPQRSQPTSGSDRSSWTRRRMCLRLRCPNAACARAYGRVSSTAFVAR